MANSNGGSRRHAIDHEFFRTIDTHEKAWLLGFAATDGVVRGSGELRFGLARRDREVLVKIKGLLGSDAPVRDVMMKCKTGTYAASLVSFHSRRVTADLGAHTVGQAKSFTVAPPAIDASLANSFWLGAIDGDGSIYRKQDVAGYGVSFCGNYEMVRGFAEFVLVTGGPSRKPRANARIFQVNYHARQHVRPLLRLLYRDSAVCLERKRRLAEIELACEDQPRGLVLYPALAELEEIRARLGSWRQVAHLIGAHPSALCVRLRALRRCAD